MNFELHAGSASTDAEGFTQYTRVFRVYTEDPTDRPEYGVAGVSINRYDAYPSDASALCCAASSVPVAGFLGWFDVTYTYNNKPFDVGAAQDTGSPGGLDAQSVTDPTARTATVRFSSNTRMIPFTKDYDSPRKPVVNSAGQPFEGQEVEDITQVITVSFNVAAATNVSTKQATYVNKVNDAAFAVVSVYGTYPEGTLRCNSWGGTLQYEPGFGWYIAAEVEFEFKWDGWEKRYIDAGHYYKVAGQYDSGGQQVIRKFRDNNVGQPLDAPRMLNGSGAPLADGAAPIELVFYPYEWVSFTNIYA